MEIRSYLVQRGQFKNISKENITGIDSLIRFEYMGSAEFEFGQLPKSLKRIIENHEKYMQYIINSVKDSEGQPMIITCNKELEDDVTINALYLAEDKLRLKEWSNMKDYIKGYEPNSYKKTDFWWDVSNDFMICFGVEKAEKIIIALDKLKEKSFGEE